MESVLEAVKTRVAVEDVGMCDADITRDEVTGAISGLNLNKNPGSDGLTA